MMEYKVLASASLINEDQLNDLAQQGWKLVTIAICGDSFTFISPAYW